MKILLAAYACEPNRGSEPGVGWKWALNLSKDKTKDVYVLTRANNRNVIESYWNNECPSNLHFFYYDLSSMFVWLKHHGLPVNIYYSLWLQGSVKYAKDLHKEYHFDMAHHITFGVFRDASMLYKLDIPYVVGPLGGGEITPRKLLPLFSFKERLSETLRSLANSISLFDPRLCKTLDKASLILTKTQDTKDILKKWKDKSFVNLEIGINNVNLDFTEEPQNTFIYVGRFTYWKGIKLVLLSFLQYIQRHTDAKLILIGKGDMEEYIKSFISTNHLEEKINIIPWIKQEDLKYFYKTSQALLFPSLHDSSGNVVLESLSFGLPVICLDCGGPASVLGDSLTDTIVSTKQKEIPEVINSIVQKMEQLTSNKAAYLLLKNKCISRAREMQWEEIVNKTYLFIEDQLSFTK